MTVSEVGKHHWDFPVVGIGASAGGIEALRRFVASLPKQTGLAFVVLQHLSPDHKSTLVHILTKHTNLSIREAADGVPVAIDCMYVAAPNQVVTVEFGALRSRPIISRTRPGIDSVDNLFESLALDCGRQAIGVVLTGTGSDGSAGVVRIKQAGGLVFAQDPATAIFNGMPSAAIATGVVDYVGSAEALAQELVRRAGESASPAANAVVKLPASNTWDDTTSQALEEILALVYRFSHFDWSGYKMTPLLWRIQHRMNLRRVAQFPDYRDLLEDDPVELEELIRALPLHVTAFFRDDKAWQTLARDVIAPLVAERPPDEPIRVCTTACASGEEAYSVAMLLVEQAQQLGANPTQFQIFATDALPEIVARASRGQFSAAAVENLSPERRGQFFYPADGHFRIKRSLRAKLIFAPHHLLQDAPLREVDLITCRNLLIYLEPQAQQHVVSQLHAALRLGGYLFLGAEESLSPRQSGFESVSTRWHIYRKIEPIQKVQLNFLKRNPNALNYHAFQHFVSESTHQTMAMKLNLPTVLVDQQLNILRSYGQLDGLLRLPPGAATLNLLQMIQPALRPFLKETISRARAENQTATFSRDNNDGVAPFTIRVTPLQTNMTAAAERLLISFIGATAPAELPMDGLHEMPDTSSAPRNATEEALQLSIEEYNASQEELQALNEELRAVNEQLNVSNDEINQVNAQLCDKIKELETQSNVLSSGHVMTLFLDESWHIRWFTPAVCDLFPVFVSDIGRRITDLVPKFTDVHFFDDVRQVLQDGVPAESEAIGKDGRCFMRRILPFRTQAKSLAGVAITFADVTDRKRTEAALRASEAKLAAADLASLQRLYDTQVRIATETNLKSAMEEILAAVCDITGTDRGCILLLDDDGQRSEMIAWRGYRDDSPFIHRFRWESCLPGLDAVRQQGRQLVIEDWANSPDLAADVTAVLQSEGLHAAQATAMICHNGTTIGVLSTQFLQPFHPSAEQLRLIDLLALAGANFVERHRVKAKLRKSEAQLAAIIEQLPVGVGLIDTTGRFISTNEQLRQLVNETLPSRDPGLQTRWRSIDPKTGPLPPEQWPGARALRGETVSPGIPFLFTDSTGAEHHKLVSAVPFRDSAGAIMGALCVIQDTTAMQRAEVALRASEERFAKAFRSNPAAIALIQLPEGRVLDMNDTWLSNFGFQRAEVIGKTTLELGICRQPNIGK